ncbi:MAG: hypothetical protein J6Q22_10800 [Prevotella sp.]|nr:hypothetical protein [Prevotella sp.]
MMLAVSRITRTIGGHSVHLYDEQVVARIGGGIVRILRSLLPDNGGIHLRKDCLEILPLNPDMSGGHAGHYRAGGKRERRSESRTLTDASSVQRIFRSVHDDALPLYVRTDVSGFREGRGVDDRAIGHVVDLARGTANQRACPSLELFSIRKIENFSPPQDLFLESHSFFSPWVVIFCGLTLVSEEL